MCQRCGQEKANDFKRKYTYEYCQDLCALHEAVLLTPKTSDNINRNSIIKLMCKCGTEFETKLFMLIDYSKFMCDSCTAKIAPVSKGESAVREYLTKNGYNFREQYSFADCVNVKRLRFDFAVFNNNNNIKIIEYDGIQHFLPSDYFGGDESFVKSQKRDGIKDSFCKNNGIPLLRIPYTKFSDIDEILCDFLTA